jgi:hypothetical protein
MGDSQTNLSFFIAFASINAIYCCKHHAPSHALPFD